MAKLTVLSFGAGQDSTALLMKYLCDQDFKFKYARKDFIVVMSDTGDEHPHTYKHVEAIRALCHKYSVAFYFITPIMGYHPKTWQGLRQWMELKNGLQAKSFPKSCTDNLKIKPIYNFLEYYVHERYAYSMSPEKILDQNVYNRMPNRGFSPEYHAKNPEKSVRKNALKEFARIYGKIDVIIGIADGEQGRVAEPPTKGWMALTLNKTYPLIDLKMDRAACQKYIEQVGGEVPVPFPSNCMLCPFMSNIELLWLYRFYPADFWYWVAREKAKLEKMKHLPAEKNHGVNGARTLEQQLALAQERHGHMTDEALNEYKFSHGHCVKSKY